MVEQGVKSNWWCDTGKKDGTEREVNFVEDVNFWKTLFTYVNARKITPEILFVYLGNKDTYQHF